MRLLTVTILCSVLASCASSPTSPSVADTNQAPTYDRPNIVLVLFEDMSSRVGAFGDPLAHTPNFDRIAAEGIAYTNVYTSAGVCAPSRAALITGRYQTTIGAQHMRTHGVLGLPGGGPQDYHAVPPPEVKAFPELLRAVGYHTTNNAKTDYQFGEPFTIWDSSSDEADWTSRAPGQPFFHMRTLITSHESFIWPVDMETTNPVEEAVVGRNRAVFAGRESLTDPADVIVPPYMPETPEVRRDLATHYDNIAFTDAVLGELYDELEEDGLLENTILIVSTDHGDGLPRAKRSLYDSGLRVPTVVRYPDGWRAGDVNDEMISFVDLGPTILSWAGLNPPAWMQGRDFSGSDRGAARNYIFAAQDRMDSEMSRRRAVRDVRYKYIRNYIPDDPYFEPLSFRDSQPSMKSLWAGYEAGTLPEAAERLFHPLPVDQLYDTMTDPYEIDNLADDPAYDDIEKRLQMALDQWLERVGDMSEMSEADMIKAMWPGGEQPVTAAPSVSIQSETGRTLVTLSSTNSGASIGYKAEGQTGWTLYTAPFEATTGLQYTAKAIRYGYAESETVDFEVEG